MISHARHALFKLIVVVKKDVIGERPRHDFARRFGCLMFEITHDTFHRIALFEVVISRPSIAVKLRHHGAGRGVREFQNEIVTITALIQVGHRFNATALAVGEAQREHGNGVYCPENLQADGLPSTEVATLGEVVPPHYSRDNEEGKDWQNESFLFVGIEDVKDQEG